MDKYDVKVALKELYAPSAKDFAIVEVPPLSYLAIDGHGDPNTAPEYAAALEALYSVAYTLKFWSKKELDRDFAVAPLEGRADSAHWFVRRRSADTAQPPPRVSSRPGAHLQRRPSRDLPERRAPHRPGEAQDDPEAAGQDGVTGRRSHSANSPVMVFTASVSDRARLSDDTGGSLITRDSGHLTGGRMRPARLRSH